MELFNGSTTNEYISRLIEHLKFEVSNMKDTEILNCDMQEWVSYLYEKYSLASVVLCENATEQTITKRTVKKYNPFSKHNSYEPTYFDVDGMCITYKIPFTGSAELLTLKPTSMILTRFNVAGLHSEKDSLSGQIIMEFEYTKKELEEKGSEVKKYVQDHFNREFSSYRTMIENVNKDIKNHNDKLPATAERLLQSRKDSASSYELISQLLEIPLQKNENAPNTTPIQLKKVPSINRPATKNAPKEYCISDKDYININNIIFTTSTTMEKTARTYISLGEEALRDILLSSLNTHYDNVTGETFRKTGKTDISIEFNNKAAYIGECKIWHGEKLFGEAVQQVLNYSTWKDTKVSVIIFNKENQSFQGVIKKISEWIDANTKRYENKATNRWSCTYHRSDNNSDIQLEIMVFDLYVDKNNIAN